MFRSTKSILSRLMLLTIETGMITGIAYTPELLLSHFSPDPCTLFVLSVPFLPGPHQQSNFSPPPDLQPFFAPQTVIFSASILFNVVGLTLFHCSYANCMMASLNSRLLFPNDSRPLQTLNTVSVVQPRQSVTVINPPEKPEEVV